MEILELGICKCRSVSQVYVCINEMCLSPCPQMQNAKCPKEAGELHVSGMRMHCCV